MGKLSDLFAQVRKARSGKGIGFVGGKNAATIKPRAAALLVELNGTNATSAEAAIKAGADGLIFTWNGQTDGLSQAIGAAQGVSDTVLIGLHLTGDWKKLARKEFEQLKEAGVNFIILPLSAPARLLGLHVKDLEPVISVPMHEGDLYPVFLRNLSAFEGLAALHLDFALDNEVGNLSIEDVLHYRAVREAIHAPALINVKGTLSEGDAYTLLALGVQAVVLSEAKDTNTTSQQVQSLRELLENVHQDDKDLSGLGLTFKG